MQILKKRYDRVSVRVHAGIGDMGIPSAPFRHNTPNDGASVRTVHHFPSCSGMLNASYTFAAKLRTVSMVSSSCTKWLGASLQTT